jgi:hypothetical protein
MGPFRKCGRFHGNDPGLLARSTPGFRAFTRSHPFLERDARSSRAITPTSKRCLPQWSGGFHMTIPLCLTWCDRRDSIWFCTFPLFAGLPPFVYDIESAQFVLFPMIINGMPNSWQCCSVSSARESKDSLFCGFAHRSLTPWASRVFQDSASWAERASILV